VELNDCVFTGNTAGDDGGAVDFYKGGFIIENCWFMNNTAVDKGGAIIGNELNTASVIRSCTFELNRSTGLAGLGGAAYLVNFAGSSFGGSSQILDCRFDRNEATYAGGAILTGDVEMTLSDSTFVGNSSPRGGALGVTNEYGPISPVLTRCLFLENQADLGGDVYLQLGARFNECDFVNSNALQGPTLFIEGSLASCGASSCCIESSLFSNPNASPEQPLINAGNSGAYTICRSTFCELNEMTAVGQPGVIGQENQYEADCPDCDQDGIPDSVAIRMGLVEDTNGDGIPDGCDTKETPCPADITGDEKVDGADLTTLLATWGECDVFCLGDIDQSGTVDGQDLALLLNDWGSCD
jgi:hypothetical protein